MLEHTLQADRLSHSLYLAEHSWQGDDFHRWMKVTYESIQHDVHHSWPVRFEAQQYPVTYSTTA